MKRTFAVAVAVAVGIGVVAALGLLAVAGQAAPRAPSLGSPIGPVMAPDTGAGELLVVVMGGVYPSKAEAESANAQMVFGDLAGYYVVPVAQFQGFKAQLATPGDFALVSAFRTEAGAQEFATFARLLGYPATVLSERVRSLGGLYAGLGQEAKPDGSGPLTDPIPASMP